ncbi:carbohydrate ABC transporter permease [Haloarcula marina]|uniref:carbohydrate ABC transporter permease n=1 Tax=Haloarcula marina TaxID=2961574 RepID=UPI0020B83A99|nr:carbohydrate ABC transporter permease [Halomicroarcula marina]
MSVNDSEYWPFGNMTLGDVAYHSLRFSLLAIYLLFIIGVFLQIISVSFRAPAEFFTQDPHWIPKEPTLTAWDDAFTRLAQPLQNSAIIATITGVLTLLIAIPGAYAFARTDLPRRELLFYFVIIALLFPYILLIIPVSDLWWQLGLFDTKLGVSLAQLTISVPFAIWVLRDFFQKLPPNLEEAAQVFGCSKFTAFARVALPLATPAIIAVGFLAFLTGWNDFLFASMLTQSANTTPAVVVLYQVTAGGEATYWAWMMAMTLAIGIPPVIMYMVARSFLSEALSFG